jgi:hypothetical protein
VAGDATPTGSARHAGATAKLKLTFHLDHSAGADQSAHQVLHNRESGALQYAMRDRLSGDLLQALTADFEANKHEVIQELRKSNPAKYAELIASLVRQAEPLPDPHALSTDDSTQDIGRKLLQSLGLPHPSQKAIEEAVAANDEFVAKLEEIRLRAEKAAI